jgi:hypothetical protein
MRRICPIWFFLNDATPGPILEEYDLAMKSSVLEASMAEGASWGGGGRPGIVIEANPCCWLATLCMAHTHCLTGKNVTVGVLDTGID